MKGQIVLFVKEGKLREEWRAKRKQIIDSLKESQILKQKSKADLETGAFLFQIKLFFNQGILGDSNKKVQRG